MRCSMVTLIALSWPDWIISQIWSLVQLIDLGLGHR